MFPQSVKTLCRITVRPLSIFAAPLFASTTRRLLLLTTLTAIPAKDAPPSAKQNIGGLGNIEMYQSAMEILERCAVLSSSYLMHTNYLILDRGHYLHDDGAETVT